MLKIGGIDNFDESIQVDDDFEKLRPEVKKVVMNIYSLETFVYKELNKASREHNRSKSRKNC